MQQFPNIATLLLKHIRSTDLINTVMQQLIMCENTGQMYG